MDIQTSNVTLHLLTFEETERVLRRQHPESELWAAGYPSVEQVDYLQAYLVELRTARPGSHWQAQLRRRRDNLVIGGAGVTGPPDARGTVVIGYELEPSLPDEGFGSEVVGALLEVAKTLGARRVITSTPPLDRYRPDAYRQCGLLETPRSNGGCTFSLDLP